VDGLLESLDCSHTLWENCPKAWAGSYAGKPGTPSIHLEGVVDYHMFFCYVSYGYTGNIGVTNAPDHLQQLVTRKDRFQELADEGEHKRLHHALMNKFG
jgi:hypothetical protein